MYKKKGFDVFIKNTCDIKHTDLTEIGNHVAIDHGFYCTTQLEIGNYVHIGPYVTCIGGKESKFIIKGYNNIMTGARIICKSDRFDDSGLFGTLIPNKYKGNQVTGDVIMEELSNVGTNAIVLPGTILRRGVLVTAGSLIMGDTIPFGVYKGNPAKLEKVINSKTIEEYYSKLKKEHDIEIEELKIF